MSSSTPAALDYLVSQIRALPEAQAPVVVSDGWPPRSDQLVVIGITPEEDDQEATGGYAELDRITEYETVEVPSLIAVRMAGTDSMKAARDRAFLIFDAIRTLVRADRRLGGAVVPGLPARISRWAVSQTADAQQAGEGRVCEIQWVVTWQHRA